MKEEYIDQYGIDSLKHIKRASQLAELQDEPFIFLTINMLVIEDKEKLEKEFGIKIMTPEKFSRSNL